MFELGQRVKFLGCKGATGAFPYTFTNGSGEPDVLPVGAQGTVVAAKNGMVDVEWEGITVRRAGANVLIMLIEEVEAV